MCGWFPAIYELVHHKLIILGIEMINGFDKSSNFSHWLQIFSFRSLVGYRPFTKTISEVSELHPDGYHSVPENGNHDSSSNFEMSHEESGVLPSTEKTTSDTDCSGKLHIMMHSTP